MKKIILNVFLIVNLFSNKLFAQSAPNISYSTPQTYTVGTAITPLLPTNSGSPVGAAAYGSGVTLGTFTGPWGIATDATDNVYITNNNANTISQFNSAGGLITNTFGANPSHLLNRPTGIIFDLAGNCYVLNSNNGGTPFIYKYNSSGTWQSTITLTGLVTASGLAIDASNNLYITNYNGTDPSTYKVFKYNTTTNALSTFVTTTNLVQPIAVALDVSGNVYVLNFANGTGTVVEFDPAGNYQSTLATGLRNPRGLSADHAGNIYVSDSDHDILYVYNSSSVSALASISLFAPFGSAVNTKGILYVADQHDASVIKFGPIGGYFISKTLPPGLSFDPATGIISGTPTATSPATTYTITAYNSSGSSSSTITIACSLLAPSITYTPAIQIYQLNTDISNYLPVNTGGPAASYTINPALPAGLNFNTTTGVISGTPTALSSVTNYTITATNATGSSTPVTVTISVVFTAPNLSYAMPGYTYPVGAAITALTPINTGGVVTIYAISPITLPAGLLFNMQTGAITGTPTTATSAITYTVTGTNIKGSSSAQVSIGTVLNPPSVNYTTPVSIKVNVAVGTAPNPSITATIGGGPVATTLGYSSTATQPLTGGTFTNPTHGGVDAAGNIYIANYSANTISKFTSGGTLITNSYGTGATLSSPTGIVFDSANNMFVLNAGTGKVYKYNSSGAYLSTISVVASTTTLGLAIDASDNLYVTSYVGSTYKVYKIAAGTSTAASYLTTITHLNKPTDVGVDASGNLYVLNFGDGTIYKYTSATDAGTSFASGFTGSYTLQVDAANGYVYVADIANSKIFVYTTSGGTAVATITGVSNCRGLTLDLKGNIYAPNYSTGIVYKYSPTGGPLFLNRPLPSGLAFNHTTGTITGTPTASSAATDYTVTAWNTAGGGSGIINITCYQLFTWVGGVSSDWNTAANWSGSVKPSNGDQAFIGTASSIVNTPIVSANTGIGSIIIGTNGTKAVSIEVNGSNTLTVSGDITYQSDDHSYTGYTASLMGTGTINAANLNIAANVSAGAFSYILPLTSSVTNLNLSGNISLTSSKPASYTFNSTFSVTGGTVTTAGIITNNDAGSISTISIGNNTVLQFTGAAALAGLSPNGINTITIGTGVTIGYTGNNNQTVYSDASIAHSLLTTGISYTNIAFSGSGKKTVLAGNLNIGGNFTNSLTNDVYNFVDLANAIVQFNGTTQSLAGGAGTGTKLYNAIFSGAGKKTITSGSFRVANLGVLTMSGTNSSTILDAGAGLLTLSSDTVGSASVATISPSGPSIIGTVKVERYLTGGSLTYRGYRLLSSPVTDPASSPAKAYYNLAYLKGTGSYISGGTGTNDGFDVGGTPAIYLYRQDVVPNNTTFISGNYRGVTKINNPAAYLLGTTDGDRNMPVGNGFLYFYRGNNSTNQFTKPNSLTFTSSGTLNQGQITVKNWYTQAATLAYNSAATGDPRAGVAGFNLVGNPYASTIDWEKFNSASSTTGIYAPTGTVDGTIYLVDPVTHQYATYKKGGGSTNGGSRYIASGQGFFVRALSATAQLVFNEDAKAADQQPPALLFNEAAAAAPLDLHLRLQLVQDSVNTEDIYLGFKPNADVGYVPNEDALYKLGNGLVSLSSLTADNRQMAINFEPLPKQSQIIPLNAQVSAFGLYQLNLTEVVNLPDMYEVWLKDAYKKDSLDMRHNPNYSFNINTDVASYDAHRFSLVIRQNPARAVHLLSFAASKGLDGAKLLWTAENENNYTRYILERSVNGGKSFQVLDSLTSASLGTYTDLDPNPVTGQNLYRLKQVDVLGNVAYSGIAALMYAPASNNIANNLINVYPNPAKATLNVAIKQDANVTAAAYKITVTSSTGMVVKTINAAQPNWQGDVSNLPPGTYFIQVVNAKDNTITGRSAFIKL